MPLIGNTTAGLYVPPSSAAYTAAGGSGTAPGSTSVWKLQGLGFLLTPNLSPGKVLVNIGGTVNWVTSGAVGVGISLQLAYGPMVNGVAAPANNTVMPGSGVAIGGIVSASNGVVLTTIGDNLAPVDLMTIVSGLTPGQQYWFDLLALSLTTATDSFLTQINCTLVEIG